MVVKRPEVLQRAGQRAPRLVLKSMPCSAAAMQLATMQLAALARPHGGKPIRSS